MFKRVAAQECGEFAVCENEDYVYALGRMHDGAIQPMNCYRVFVSSPLVIRTFTVLAQDEAEAIDQARCAADLESYRVDSAEEKLIFCRAEREPLVIRGWGRTTF